MSATEKAAIPLAPAKASNDIELQPLIERIKEIEHKYKLGNVDSELEKSDGDSQVQWQFEEQLNTLAELIREHKGILLSESPSWYYKFIAIRAEAKEYFNTASVTDRLDLFLEAKELYRELPKQLIPSDSSDDNEELITWKNKIRVIVAGLEYLHSTGDFGTAINFANGLLDFVNNRGLATKTNPAFGTRAVIYHFIGRTLSQRGIDDDYNRAIDYFYQCSESYFEMARRRGNNEVDVIYARTRAMVSLAFGAGFLFYNAHSDLMRAKAQIAQARLAFLKDDGTICCKLHYHYLELLYASILRAEAGEVIEPAPDEDAQVATDRSIAREKLERAREILDRCDSALRNKPKYFVYVLYNKALVYLYQGRPYYDDAREHIVQLLRECQDNPRSLSQALVLKSHLERRMGEPDTALSDALKAYNQAGNHLPGRVEALLARGQAQVSRNQLNAAQTDFERALQLNNSANLKLTAMGHLLLTELAIAQHKPAEAHQRFARAKALMPSIRHGFIRNKFRQLEKHLVGLQTDFVIAGNTDELDYKQCEIALQRWLLEKALREDRSLTRAAQRLKVSKRTVYMWMDKYNIKI